MEISDCKLCAGKKADPAHEVTNYEMWSMKDRIGSGWQDNEQQQAKLWIKSFFLLKTRMIIPAVMSCPVLGWHNKSMNMRKKNRKAEVCPILKAGAGQ